MCIDRTVVLQAEMLGLVRPIVLDKTNAGEAFTYHDITTAVREANPDKEIVHKDVRDYVGLMWADLEIPDNYSHDVFTLADMTSLWIFYPSGTHPTDKINEIEVKMGIGQAQKPIPNSIRSKRGYQTGLIRTPDARGCIRVPKEMLDKLGISGTGDTGVIVKFNHLNRRIIIGVGNINAPIYSLPYPPVVFMLSDQGALRIPLKRRQLVGNIEFSWDDRHRYIVGDING